MNSRAPLTPNDVRWLSILGVGECVCGMAVYIVALATTHGFSASILDAPPLLPSEAILAVLLGSGLLAFARGYLRVAMSLGLLAALLPVVLVVRAVLETPLPTGDLLTTLRWAIAFRTAAYITPYAAIGFSLSGVSLSLAALGWVRHWSLNVLVGIVFSTAFVPVLILITQVIPGLPSTPYHGLSLPTLAYLILTVLALIRLNRGRRLMDEALQFMAMALGMLLFIGATAVSLNLALAEANRAVQQSYETKGTIDYLVAEVARMESSARAFGLTGNQSFRERDGYHRSQILRSLADLDRETEDEPDQASRARKMRELVVQKLAQIAALEEARENGGSAAAGRFIAELPTQQTSQFVTLADEMWAVENTQLSKRNSSLAATNRTTRVRQIIGSLFALGLLGAAASLARKSAEARAAAERELRTTNSLLKATLDGTVLSVIATNPSGTIELFNAGAEQMLAYRREEVIGKATPEIIHHKDTGPERADTLSKELGEEVNPGFEALIARARSGIAEERESTYVRKDGTHLPVLVSVTALRDENEAITGFLEVALDLTERKRAEESLHATRIRLEKIFESMSEGLVLQDATGTIVECNQAAERILGLSRDQLNGRTSVDPAWHCIHEDGSFFPGTEHPVTITLHTGVPQRNVIMGVFKPDKTLTWIELNTVAIGDVGDPKRQAICSFRDITERKAAQEELLRSREFLATVTSILPGLVSYWTRDLACVFANKSHGEWFGNDASQALGLVAGDGEDSLVPRLLKGIPQSIERTITRSDGHLRETWAQYIPDFNPDHSTVRGFVVLVTDITEQKKAVHERQQLERKLQEAQKLESLGVLAGGIAHDFNNILTGVLGNASLASSDLPQSSPVQDYLEAIKKGSRQAAELCKQMLAYSGRGRFVVQNLSLNTLVEETTHLLQISISKKAVLRFDLYPSLPAVAADATQLRQVIMNLVINASEAIGDKSGVISITTGLTRVDRDYLSGTLVAPEIQDGTYVSLEVSDNGSGMSPDTQAKIFDPFFTTKFAGRGLGLAAVLGIVRGHKGTIKIYSELGRGTTFKVLLPCVSGAVVSEQPGVSSRLWQGKGLILVVDDEESVRTTAAMMLRKFGFEVTLATNGREALELFSGDPGRFTLVLMDLTMPHMDGRQAFAEMRRLKPDARIILMSGFTEQEAISQFTGKGLADFLQKPFEPDSLARVLQRSLEAS